MGESLVITSGKGGVGKSTLAVNLAVSLVKMGKTAVLIDADTGLRNLDVLLGLENNVVYDLTDVAEGVCRLKQAIIKCQGIAGLSLIAAAQLRDSSSVSPAQLEVIVRQLKNLYDHVIIDCPAGIDAGFRAAVASADQALVVVLNDAISIRDAERVKGLLARADLSKPLLVINRALPEKRKKNQESYCVSLASRLDMRLIGVVPETGEFLRAAQSGQPVALGRTQTAAEFDRIARRLLGEEIPFKPVKRRRLIMFGR